MTTTTGHAHATAGIAVRVLSEGYGAGAWHGPDLKAALAEVTPPAAFRRPAEGRHNIAEIALHHAYYVRAVRAQLSGREPDAFVLEGEDWFAVSDEGRLTWPQIQAAVETEHGRLAQLVEEIDAGRQRSPLAAAERLNLVLGITCHAVYHAGQVQLIRRLIAA